jgi:hypothetical protein
LLPTPRTLLTRKRWRWSSAIPPAAAVGRYRYAERPRSSLRGPREHSETAGLMGEITVWLLSRATASVHAEMGCIAAGSGSKP